MGSPARVQIPSSTEMYDFSFSCLKTYISCIFFTVSMVFALKYCSFGRFRIAPSYIASIDLLLRASVQTPFLPHLFPLSLSFSIASTTTTSRLFIHLWPSPVLNSPSLTHIFSYLHSVTWHIQGVPRLYVSSGWPGNTGPQKKEDLKSITEQFKKEGSRCTSAIHTKCFN